MKGVDDIHSWLLGLDGDVNFGPLYLAAAVSVGQNWSDAGWNDETGCISDTWTGNYFSNNFGKQLIWLRDASAGGTSYWEDEDTTSLMLSAVAAYRLTEALRFEVGAGYRYDRNDAFNKNSNIWNVYLQASYTVVPGFTILPEIGYIDFGKTAGRKHYYYPSRRSSPAVDAGYLWYAGAQWRMDF